MKKILFCTILCFAFVISLSLSAKTYVYAVNNTWINANLSKGTIGYSFMENLKGTTYSQHQAYTVCGAKKVWGSWAGKGKKSQTASTWCSMWDSAYTSFNPK